MEPTNLYHEKLGLRHRFASTGSTSKTTDRIDEQQIEKDIVKTDESLALLRLNDRESIDENDHDDSFCTRRPSTSIWSWIRDSIQRKLCFTKLLVDGLDAKYPQLAEILNCATKAKEIFTLVTMFGRFGLTLMIGNCQIRNETDVLVLIVRESELTLHYVHRLEKMGEYYHVCDFYYTCNNLRKRFKAVDITHEYYWIAG